MKKFLFIFIFIFSLFLKANVYAASNPYKKTFNYNGHPLTNCTWYAWDQASRKAQVNLPGWGNAATWYNSAKNAGFEVGSTPRAKSIVVWSWYNSNGKNLGHVGYVEKVVGDRIYVWDSDSSCHDENYPPFKECMDKALLIDQAAQEECYVKYAKQVACEYSASYWSIPGDLIGYIYLDNAPVVKTTKKTTKVPTTKKTTTTTTTTEPVSQMPYLNNIELSNGTIDFKKDVYKYEIEITDDISELSITATPESDDLLIQGDGKVNLVAGQNEFIIKVYNDTNETTYTITINKRIVEKEQVINNEKKEKKFLSREIIISIIIGVVLFIIVIVIYICIHKKRIS